MNVDGAVTIDLRVIGEHEVLRGVQSAVYAPTGASVEFLVSPSQWPPFQGVRYLRENGQHLGQVTVKCPDPDTVRQWVGALRGEAA